MNNWGKFNQTSLPRKEDFYSYLNMEDITDAEYTHTKRVCKDFEINNIAQYHEVFVQSETLLLADVFENFLRIFEIFVGKYMNSTQLVFLLH